MSVSEEATNEATNEAVYPGHPEWITGVAEFHSGTSTVTLTKFARYPDTSTEVITFPVPPDAWGCFRWEYQLSYASPQFFVLLDRLTTHLVELRKAVPTRIAELRLETENAVSKRQRIAERLRDHAIEKRWCGEYETWAEEHGGLSREREYLVTVDVSVTARDEDSACEEVQQALRHLDVHDMNAELSE